MLHTQVAYWANKETHRHNLATEAATVRDLERKEQELQVSIRDLERKEKETESTIWKNKQEVQIKKGELAELKRHNVKTESNQYKQAVAALKQAEAALKNAETNRKNLANLRMQAQASLEQARAATRNAATNAQLAQVKTVETIHSIAKQATEKKKNIAQAKEAAANARLKSKESAYYETTKVAVPVLTGAANILLGAAAL